MRETFSYDSADLPRPAVSNAPGDVIEELDIFSDDGCGEPLAMSEEVNPYKLMHDINWMKYYYKGADSSGTCNGPLFVEANADNLKIQAYLDHDGATACPRLPGLVYLEGKSGDCLPFVGNENALTADGAEQDVWEDNRVTGAMFFVKFKLRKVSTTATKPTEPIDVGVVATLAIALCFSILICACVCAIFAKNMKK